MYFLIILTITLSLIDVSGDFMLMLSDTVNELFWPSRALISIAMPILLFRGFYLLLKCDREVRYISLCIGLILSLACFNGLISNNPIHALRELTPFGMLFVLPILTELDDTRFEKFIRYFIRALIIVGVIKLCSSQIISIIYQGIPSWKIILRISPLFIFPYVYYLCKIQYGEKFKVIDVVVLVVCLVLILSAQARALNLVLLLCSLMVVSSKANITRILIFGSAVFIAGGIATYFTDFEYNQIFGIWSGEHFDDAVDYRTVQWGVLIDRYIESPIIGAGLGYYTKGYLSYEQLELPYLLELDILNFFSKIGLVLSFVYVNLVLFILRPKNRMGLNSSNFDVFAAKASLVSIYLYSIFQTMHSSILFWLAFSIFTAIIIRSRRLS